MVNCVVVLNLPKEFEQKQSDGAGTLTIPLQKKCIFHMHFRSIWKGPTWRSSLWRCSRISLAKYSIIQGHGSAICW